MFVKPYSSKIFSGNFIMISNQWSLYDRWTIGTTEEANTLKVKKRLRNLAKPRTNTHIDLSIFEKTEMHYLVACDESRITQIGKLSLYSTHLASSNLVILGRAFQNKKMIPRYTSLTHISKNLQNFQNTLEELVEKINKKGKIELFYSGGDESSNDNIKEIKKIVSSFRQKYSDVYLFVKHNTFKIADLGVCLIFTDFPGFNFKSQANISCVGFDQDSNPYQVLHCEYPSQDIILKKEGPTVAWVDG